MENVEKRNIYEVEFRGRNVKNKQIKIKKLVKMRLILSEEIHIVKKKEQKGKE